MCSRFNIQNFVTYWCSIVAKCGMEEKIIIEVFQQRIIVSLNGNMFLNSVCHKLINSIRLITLAISKNPKCLTTIQFMSVIPYICYSFHFQTLNFEYNTDKKLSPPGIQLIHCSLSMQIRQL